MTVRLSCAAAVALGLGGLLAAASLSAAQTSSGADSDAQADAAVMAFYPAKARADRIEGSATLVCGSTEHMALKDCVLKGEAPGGYGFGEAALALARQSKENPAVVWKSDRRDPVTFAFRLTPPSISPNTLVAAHAVTDPNVLSKPSIADVVLAYPDGALNRQVSGKATLDCAVTVDGRLDRCAVADETPSGQGFGRAALKLASRYRLTPLLYDGRPQDGARVRLPVNFSAPQ